MCGIAVGNDQVAAGDGSGYEECTGLDTVGIDAVLDAVQPGDSLNADGWRSCAFNMRSHGDEHGGQVGDFGFTGTVLEERFAFGEDSGHEQIFGTGDGDLVEDDVRAFEAFGAGFKITVLLGDHGAHFFKALQMQVDGAAANGAASGHSDARHAAACDQRTENEGAGAHGFDDFVLGDGVGESLATDGGAVLCASVAKL